MSDEDQALELNTLQRFSKTSPRLILEENGSCEVPAGCGGVVLRWLDPRVEVPLLFRIHTPGKFEFYLDGQAQISSAPLVGYGKHVLALHFSELPVQEAAFVLAARRKPDQPERAPDLLSRPGAAWKGVASQADRDWLHPEYDDSSWASLEELPLSPPANGYRYARLLETGALPLGLKTRVAELWVRCRFEFQP
jgi:hypothetical protein